ncbi:MAG: response regulator [Syntrophobacteraceae bacterium]
MDAAILVIDDEESVREMIASFLKTLGYHVDSAEGVGAALDIIESHEYGVMLVDKNMPGKDGRREAGIDFLRQVRSQGMSSEVIIMTGYPTVETALETMKLGAFDYLVKPFSLETLQHKVERVLEYRKFINSDYTCEIYRDVRGEILSLIENRSNISSDDLDRSILTLDGATDKIFRVLREYEKILFTQREALAKIASLSEQSRVGLPDADSLLAILDEISTQSGNRI